MAILKSGWTQTPNLIYDLIAEMKEAEIKVVMTVVRETIGWQRQSIELTMNDFQRLTKMARASVVAGIKDALDRGVISRTKGNGKSYSYTIPATQTCAPSNPATHACVPSTAQNLNQNPTPTVQNSDHQSLPSYNDNLTNTTPDTRPSNRFAISEMDSVQQLYATRSQMSLADQVALTPSGVQPWSRLPGEPSKWYSRFEIYLSIGPERSVRMAYLKVRQERDEPLAGRWAPPAGGYSSWLDAARAWNWVERAEAWDEQNRENHARRNEQQRTQERETRIKIITQQLHIADIALLAAQLDTLTVDQARRLLPTIRLLLRDMLDQHRLNLEPPPTYDNGQTQELIPFTADELAALTRDLAKSNFWEQETTN